MQRLGPGQIEHRLVDRQRLQQWREARHHPADLPPDGDVFFEVWADHDSIRTRLQCLEHRHRAAHAVDARDIAGRGDNAAHAATDNHRLGCQFRPITLLHTGVERIAVDMRDGQVEQFGMPQDPLALARRTAGR